MTVKLTVTRKVVDTSDYVGWDAACGDAVRESLEGAESVVVTDANGVRYNIYANAQEDNS